MKKQILTSLSLSIGLMVSLSSISLAQSQKPTLPQKNERVSPLTLGRIPLSNIDTSPAVAFFDGKFYIAQKGYGSDEHVQYISCEPIDSEATNCTNGTGWGTPTTLKTTGMAASVLTTEPPALAGFKGRLYLAHKGAGTDNRIYYTSTANGVTWAPEKTAPGSMSGTPALTIFNNKLYLAYAGTGTTAHQLWYTSTTDGRNWSGEVQVPIAGSAPVPAGLDGSPALGVPESGSTEQAALGFGYRAQNSTELYYSIYYKNSDGNWTWSPPVDSDLSTNGSPAAGPFGQLFYWGVTEQPNNQLVVASCLTYFYPQPGIFLKNGTAPALVSMTSAKKAGLFAAITGNDNALHFLKTQLSK